MNTAIKNLSYDPLTGVLVWKHGKHAGRMAGAKQPNGYSAVRIARKLRLCHRIAWEIANGPIPDGKLIDHINGIPTDNRIGNLRLASKAENGFNARQQKRAIHKGVWFDKSRNAYQAYVTANKRRHRLGRFPLLSDAIRAVKDARERLHGAFARHGDAS